MQKGMDKVQWHNQKYGLTFEYSAELVNHIKPSR